MPCQANFLLSTPTVGQHNHSKKMLWHFDCTDISRETSEKNCELRNPCIDEFFALKNNAPENEIMINLMTYCRRFATLCALTTLLSCSQVFSQDVDLSMTQTPLAVGDLPTEAPTA